MNIPNPLPGANDGRVYEAGHAIFNSGDETWHDVFHSYTNSRWGKPYPTPREFAENYGGFMLWDPFGRHLRKSWRNPRKYVPLDLLGELHVELDENASNPVLQHNADVEEFVAAASLYKAQGFYLGIYTGGPDSFKKRPFQTDDQYASEMESCLMPLLSITPHIDGLWMDHWLGIKQPETAGFNILRTRLLNHYGIPLGIEPAQLASAVELYDAPTLAGENFDRREDWMFKVDGQLQPLLDRKLVSQRIIWLNKLNKRKTVAEKLAAIEAVKSDGNIACVPMHMLAELEGG